MAKWNLRIKLVRTDSEQTFTTERAWTNEGIDADTACSVLDNVKQYIDNTEDEAALAKLREKMGM